MIDEYYEGKGCKCHAHSEWECACPDVDWTDPEVYELRKWKEAIEEQLEICGLNTINYKDPKEALYHLVHYQMEGAYNEGLRASEWKEAVLEELMTWHIYRYEHEKNPRKALHDLALVNSDVAIYFHEQKKWHKRLKNKIIEIWYRTPFPYWLYKLAKIQPPF
jgi:hypothetical protein